jgi:aspartate/methionine/tyrosine aminotransferase
VFSSRLPGTLESNAISRLLKARRADGCSILDLTEWNPTRAGFKYPNELLAALAEPRSLLYEPEPFGHMGAREAVAAYYIERRHSVDREDVVLTSSTSEAYSWIFKLLADSGDQVLVPRPSYPLFDFLAGLESVQLVDYRLVYHGGWSIDLDALAQSVTPRTRAIVIVNPNNPTGSFLKQDELRAIAALGVPLISDEVFSDYAFQPDQRRVRSLASFSETLVFSLSGLSKTVGLPQMKLGWIVVSGPERPRRDAVARLELIADTFLSVGTPVQHAVGRMLERGREVREQIRARTRENLDVLRSLVGSDSPAHVLTVEGGWYATVQVPRTRSEEEWALHLLGEHDVLVQPGFFFDFDAEAFLVLSLLTRPDVFSEGVRRLLRSLP